VTTLSCTNCLLDAFFLSSETDQLIAIVSRLSEELGPVTVPRYGWMVVLRRIEYYNRLID